jgi:uncharacterized membrane protein
VSGIRHEYIGTATGLMLTLAAVGGFFMAIILGHLVPHTSFDTGWVFLAIVTVFFALAGLFGRNVSSEAPEPAGSLASHAADMRTRRGQEEAV